MNFKNQSYKTTFILGAGATRGALRGISRPIVRAPLNSDFFKVAKRFVSCHEGKRYKNCYARLNRFIEEEMIPIKKKSPTMEEAFTVLFMSKDLPEVFRGSRGKIKKEGFRSEINDFFNLVVAIFRFIQENMKHKNNFDHYSKLVSMLEEGDTVITLNYDTMIDNALTKLGWKPDKGYAFNASSKVNYKSVKPPRGIKRLKNVYLLKPHGSLNWFARGTITSLEMTLSTKSVSRIEMAEAPRLYNLRRGAYVRFFIPPLYTKFFNNKFWRDLWHKSYEKLKSCDCLVIIGCSLITTDYHLRAILSKVLKSRKKKFKKIIIVDKKHGVQDNLKKFFRGKSTSGCDISYRSFTDFVK